MIKEIIPLITLGSFLLAVYSLTQVMILTSKKKDTKTKFKNYEKSDAFGLVRAYLGIICMWMIYIIWGFG